MRVLSYETVGKHLAKNVLSSLDCFRRVEFKHGLNESTRCLSLGIYEKSKEGIHPSYPNRPAIMFLKHALLAPRGTVFVCEESFRAIYVYEGSDATKIIGQYLSPSSATIRRMSATELRTQYEFLREKLRRLVAHEFEVRQDRDSKLHNLWRVLLEDPAMEMPVTKSA